MLEFGEAREDVVEKDVVRDKPVVEIAALHAESQRLESAWGFVELIDERYLLVCCCKGEIDEGGKKVLQRQRRYSLVRVIETQICDGGGKDAGDCGKEVRRKFCQVEGEGGEAEEGLNEVDEVCWGKMRGAAGRKFEALYGMSPERHDMADERFEQVRFGVEEAESAKMRKAFEKGGRVFE